jgi:hypothetical protein
VPVLGQHACQVNGSGGFADSSLDIVNGDFFQILNLIRIYENINWILNSDDSSLEVAK